MILRVLIVRWFLMGCSGDGVEAQFGGFLEHHLPGGVSVVGDNAVEDGVFDGVFDCSDFAARGDVEGSHDVFAADRGLEIANAVAFFQLD